MSDASPNPTAKKFGFPETLIASYTHWLVLARPQQPVLGSVVLLCRDDAHSFSKISADAFTELALVTADIETALRAVFRPDKLNYLMLMMVDPDVHFHVLPRYQSGRAFAGHDHVDAFWPRPVDLTQPVQTDAALVQEIRAQLTAVWPSARR